MYVNLFEKLKGRHRDVFQRERDRGDNKEDKTSISQFLWEGRSVNFQQALAPSCKTPFMKIEKA